MLRRLLIAFAALTLVVACTKQKKQDISQEEITEGSNADQGPTSSDVVMDGQSIAYDSTGSDGGKINGLNTIFFDYDTATITQESKRILAENAQWMKNNKASVQIEGHCDERGSIEYNLALGERRARSVKSYLTSLGVDGNRLTIISYGEEKPLIPGDSEAAWAKNRRANFVPMAQ